MKPIPLNAFAKLLGVAHPGQNLILGVAIDSRKVQPGDLFFALPGNRVDGHAFIEVAASQGAVGAVVSEDYRGGSHTIPLLYVPCVLTALQEAAKKILAKSSSKVIAITGSLGKTTTKEFAAALLSTRYKVFSSPLSYNSQATVPLSILMADGTEDYLVLEMGMTHAGNIEKLISIAPPSISLLTTLAIQHAVNFSDGLAGICKEKASVFTHPKTELGILNRDIPHYKEVFETGQCPKKTFSLAEAEADYFLETIEEGVRIYTQGEPAYDLPFTIPVKAHYQNFLAAVALARNLNVPWPSIRDAARFLKLPAMRFQAVERSGIVFINDAYNANPDSMKAALESLPKPQPGGKVIAVLGEMDALGMYTEVGHAMVAETALQHVDHLLCLGAHCKIMHKIWKQEKKPVELFETRASLEDALKHLARPGDVILLKGARAHALEEILNAF